MNPGRINEWSDLSKMPPQLEGLNGKEVFTKEDVEKMFNALSGYVDNYTNYRINEIKRFVGLPYKLEENEFDAEHNMEPHYVGPQDFEKYADKNVEKVPELNENKQKNKTMKKIRLTESQYSKLQDQLMLENLTTKLEKLTSNNEPVVESTEVTQYNVVVKHDKGKTTIKTSGSSEQAAKEKVMKAENCPESAIISITPIKDDETIDEAQRTLGFGYHGGLKSKGVGKAGNKRDINEEIADIKKWNHILLKENYASEYDIQMPTAEPETDETDSMDLDDFLSQVNDKKMGHNPMKTKFGGKVQLNLNTGKWEARPEEWEDLNEYSEEPQSNQDYVDPMSAAKSNSRQYYDATADAIEYVGGVEAWEALSDEEKNDVISQMEPYVGEIFEQIQKMRKKMGL